MPAEQFLPEPVISLPLPFRGQQGDDLGVAGREDGPVPPYAGRRVGFDDPLRILRVPEGLGDFDLLVGGFGGEGGC